MSHENWHVLWIAFGGTAMLGKLFLMLARTMPPPPEDCKFWCRWAYDFFQIAAENQDKAGKSQDPTKPIGQAIQTLSASATTVQAPSGIDVLAVSTPAKEIPKP